MTNTTHKQALSRKAFSGYLCTKIRNELDLDFPEGQCDALVDAITVALGEYDTWLRERGDLPNESEN